MSGGSRGGTGGELHRRCAPGTGPAPLLLLALALLLAGCPAPAGDADPSRQRPTAASADAVPAPPLATPADATTGPGVTVDVAAGAGPAQVGLDVAGTPDGGAVVLLGETAAGWGARVVRVSAGGERTDPVPVPGMVVAWDLHLLPDGSALVTGRLAAEEALGYAVVDPASGGVRTVAAVPLDRATHDVVGDSAVSPDGGTVWLYSGMLVDGRYSYFLTGHDLASGELVASRDLFGELRALHAADQRLDVVGLTGTPAGTVVLAVNAFRSRHAPFWSPVLLVYDTMLEPRAGPVDVARSGARGTATALATAGDGTPLVLVRGWPVSTLVALPAGASGPERRLELPGYGGADEVVIDSGGRAIVRGGRGVRSIDLASGATAEIDLGCSGAVTVQALASRSTGGAWVLGGCFEEGNPPSVLWSAP